MQERTNTRAEQHRGQISKVAREAERTTNVQFSPVALEFEALCPISNVWSLVR